MGEAKNSFICLIKKLCREIKDKFRLVEDERKLRMASASAAEASEAEMPTSTLFVRSLPFSASDKSLEDVFSQFGPLQQCFVVKDAPNNNNNNNCKGYGFVRFATWRDAKKAKESVETLGGRKIQVNYSKPRVGFKNRKGMPSRKAEGERDRIRTLLKGRNEDAGGGGEGRGGGGEDISASSTSKPFKLPFDFLVTNLPPLPTDEDPVAELTAFFSDVPGFDKVTLVTTATTAAAAAATSSSFKISFTSKHLAMIAKKSLLKGKKFRGCKLSLV